MEFCEEILDSRLPSSAPLDIGTLPDTARRISSSRKNGGSDDRGLRFNSSWKKLEKGVSLLIFGCHVGNWFVENASFTFTSFTVPPGAICLEPLRLFSRDELW
jgi:hypothetical protein